MVLELKENFSSKGRNLNVTREMKTVPELKGLANVNPLTAKRVREGIYHQTPNTYPYPIHQ